MKRISLVEHLSWEEIETHYRKAKDGVARGQWQVIWLLAQGKRAQDIAEVTGYSYTWVREIVHRYNQRGPQAVGDARHENPGGQFILSVSQQRELQETLEDDPPDGGLWTGPKVAIWIAQQTGRPVHAQRGWEYLKRLGYSKRVLRPRHAKADPEQQDAFIKNSESRLPRSKRNIHART